MAQWEIVEDMFTPDSPMIISGEKFIVSGIRRATLEKIVSKHNTELSKLEVRIEELEAENNRLKNADVAEL